MMNSAAADLSLTFLFCFLAPQVVGGWEDCGCVGGGAAAGVLFVVVVPKNTFVAMCSLHVFLAIGLLTAEVALRRWGSAFNNCNDIKTVLFF